MTDNPSIRIYANNRENGIIFEIITGYYLKLVTPETMKLPRSNINKVTEDEIGERSEVVLVHCHIGNNDYQIGSTVLYTFLLNKSFDQILDIWPKNFIFRSEFSYLELWFADQNSKPLEIELLQIKGEFVDFCLSA